MQLMVTYVCTNPCEQKELLLLFTHQALVLILILPKFFIQIMTQYSSCRISADIGEEGKNLEEFLVELWQFRLSKCLPQTIGSKAKKKIWVVLVVMIRSLLVVELDCKMLRNICI